MTPAKRVLDVLVAGLVLLLVWPLFLLLPLLIWLDDGRPIFFRQERIGRGGRPFRMWKFRSMRAAEGLTRHLTVGADPRITRVGRWLRELKLDELPQFVHVLAGQMTLVGPRPEVARYVQLYTPAQAPILALVPGVTGPASLRFWDEADILARSHDPEETYIRQIMPEKIRIQLEYAGRATAWTDLRLVGLTAFHMWPKSRPLLLEQLLQHRRLLIVLVHLVLIAIGYRGAYELRFDFAIPPDADQLYWITLPLLIAVRLLPYARFGVFQGYWRHAGLEDLVALAKAASLGSLVFTAALTAVGLFPGVPRSVLLLDWAGAIFLAGGIRFVVRYVREGPSLLAARSTRRTLVVGTGDQADRLLREVHRDPSPSLEPIGLVSVQPTARGRAVRGVRVLGAIDDLVTLVSLHRIELVVITLDQPAGELMRRVATACLHARVEFKILPSLHDLLDGGARIDQLREVDVVDLLGRLPVQLDLSRVGPTIEDRVVLITGGAGSIGSELARQIAKLRPRRLVLLDQAESALYFTVLEIAEANPGIEVIPVVADITDGRNLLDIFGRWRPEYVIHTAAYKHVPMMEDNIVEAVRNNVLGTLLVANAASSWGAERFVLVSTDKAVRPSSVMGATKRIAERLILELPALRRSTVDFRAVRFGNVLGSAGSVVPLFERQVAARKAVTVTHPDVERYFMTIPEATQLVLEAGALREAARRITMLEMGEPVRILDLARRLIRLAGLEPHRDVPIVFTGLRPGEKLREELMTDLEHTIATSVDKIRVVQGGPAGDGSEIARTLGQMAQAVATGDSQVLIRLMCDLIPEAVPPLSERRVEPPSPRRSGTMDVKETKVGETSISPEPATLP